MRFYLLCFIITVFAVDSIAQEITLLPKWKKGEKKTFVRSYYEAEYENDTLVESDTMINKGSMEVIGEDKTSYTLEILYDNLGLATLSEFNDELTEVFADDEFVRFVYKVDKKTGEYELTNWSETIDFMNESIDSIMSYINTSDTSTGAMLLGLIMVPIQEMFKSEEAVNEYMNDEIGFMFDFLGKQYAIGTVEEEESVEVNPLDPQNSVTITTKTTLQEIDAGGDMCKIKQTVHFDLTEFKKMMVDVMKMMMEMFSAEDSTSVKAEQEMMDFEMDMTTERVVNMNYKTAWPESSVVYVEITGTDPMKGGNSRRLMRSVVELN